VKSVQTFKDEGVYEAAKKGLFSMELIESACSAIKAKKPGTMKENAKNPQAVVIDYNDGSRGVALVMDDYYGSGWGFAAKVNGKIEVSEVILPDAPFNHFSYLGLNAQEMFLTGKPQTPVERTLYASSIMDMALRSLYNGSKLIRTPFLNIKYKPFPFEPIHPTLTKPKLTPKEWSSIIEYK
jgi:hypothetical protein